MREDVNAKAASPGMMEQWGMVSIRASELADLRAEVTRLTARETQLQKDMDEANDYHIGILNVITQAFPECHRVMLADSVNAMIAYTQKARSDKKVVEAVSEPLHPWYGPCDGFMPAGECSECYRVAHGDAAMEQKFRVGQIESIESLRAEVARLQQERENAVRTLVELWPRRITPDEVLQILRGEMPAGRVVQGEARTP